jgi:hypothetical protein
MDSEQEIRRGHEAQRLLENPLMVEAFEAIEKALIANLMSVPLVDTQMEREIVRTLQVMGKLKGHIEQVIVTGRMAEVQKESMTKRVIRAVRG